MKKQIFETSLNGIPLIAEFNDLADQASGSVIIRYENTLIMATAVMSMEEKNADFFPLTVDYEEKFYAVGKILGSRYQRREGKPTDEAILSGRVIDRTIRPLFDDRIRNEVQVVVTTLSIGNYDPTPLSVLAASLALGTSDIPWNGPVSAVHLIEKEKGSIYTINPSYDDTGVISYIDLVCCGKDGNINMIEVLAKEATEDDMTLALSAAEKEIQKLQEFQKKIISEIGKPKRVLSLKDTPTEIDIYFEEEYKESIKEKIFSGADKKIFEELKQEWIQAVHNTCGEEKTIYAERIFENKVNDLIHEEAVVNERRTDGRKLNEIRPLYAQAGNISSILHGTGIFYRGGTHVLSVLTLAGPGESQILDGIESQSEKRYMHHYNFPPFSTGETGKMGGTNRRMIGHGALAEKALLPVLPSQEQFPYTIRVVSESMASNGSTSMASVCASTLALMDGGVPITSPVAGIAMGLMIWKNSYKILTDIQGPEDHHGDMDFKVAGTEKGITAVQMDVKVDGVSIEILKEAFAHAKEARQKILVVIKETISSPRQTLSPSAPKILSTHIHKDQIGPLIGPGGKNINKIKEDTKTEIDIQEDGTVFVTGKGNSPEEAIRIIKNQTHTFNVGEKYIGEVIRIADFGAIVKLNSHTEGLLHISEISQKRIDTLHGILELHQKVPVLIKEIDEKGRIKLSIKDIDPHFAEQVKQTV